MFDLPRRRTPPPPVYFGAYAAADPKINGGHACHIWQIKHVTSIYGHTKNPNFSAPERFFILIFAIPPLFRTRNTVKNCITTYDQYFRL
jgi:hypothetical protein